MPAPDFHFTPIASAADRLWQVRKGGPAGRLLGTVVGEYDGYQATHVAPDGKLMLHWAADRDAAARWLSTLAPTD